MKIKKEINKLNRVLWGYKYFYKAQSEDFRYFKEGKKIKRIIKKYKQLFILHSKYLHSINYLKK